MRLRLPHWLGIGRIRARNCRHRQIVTDVFALTGSCFHTHGGSPNDGTNWPGRRAKLHGVLRFVLACGPFWPALRGSYMLDDDIYVTANSDLRFTNVVDKIYRHAKSSCC